MEERGWETCQYKRKEAFRISAMVAVHLNLGEATNYKKLTGLIKATGLGDEGYNNKNDSYYLLSNYYLYWKWLQALCVLFYGILKASNVVGTVC